MKISSMSENLESLINSLKITELNKLVYDCELLAIQNIRLKSLLKKSFNKKTEEISSNLSIMKRKQTKTRYS